MKKCTNLANSTFNLYVPYIKLAQNTTQFRRLIQRASLLSLIHYSVENAFMGLGPGFLGC